MKTPPQSKATTSNPKDIFGSAKVSLTKFPSTALAHGAHAFMDGVVKYGAYNWRDKPIIASIYVDGAMRHILDWWEGQKLAVDSGVHHLGHALACIAILIDAEENKVLIDDRPIFENPEVLDKLLNRLSEIIKQRKASLVVAHALRCEQCDGCMRVNVAGYCMCEELGCPNAGKKVT